MYKQSRTKTNIASQKRRQFLQAESRDCEYKHRLNFYQNAPARQISLDEFELWASDRLKALDGCAYRYADFSQIVEHALPQVQKWLPLSANSSSPLGSSDEKLILQRQKDHYSHFILRLAFAGTEDLRRRFTKLESLLFKIRILNDDYHERQAFIESLDLGWQHCSQKEAADLKLDSGDPDARKRQDSRGPREWFKLDFENVPELIENRRVKVLGGSAYVHVREQTTLVSTAFSKSLEEGLQIAARALPRLDEDDRLRPILLHLGKYFNSANAQNNEAVFDINGRSIMAGDVDQLSQHFPACMQHLHSSLRSNAHLKHYGRLQYTLFLKGIGLSLEESLKFWRQAFNKINEDTFNKEYRYNVKHAYGEVGGDANRRGQGYSPFSCQKILTEHPPSAGESHGCPYRHFNLENLFKLLQSESEIDPSVLRSVKHDIDNKRYHIACNQIFEHKHKHAITIAKQQGSWTDDDNAIIVHPNTYFKRSLALKSANGPNPHPAEEK